MKRLLLFVLVLSSMPIFSQPRRYSEPSSSIRHWEDDFWREDTRKKYAKTFTMAGLYTGFYENGQVKWQGKCLENGTPDSTWVYYDENGYKIWEGEYNGKYIEYLQVYDYDYYDGDGDGYENKQRKDQDTALTGHYRNGLKDGEWVQYDYNGDRIKKIGHYSKGEPTGIWQEFKEEKVVKSVKMTEYNYATQTYTYYGKDSTTTKFVDSLKNDAWLKINPRSGYYSSVDDEVTINLSPVATAHFINLDRLNNFYHQPGSVKLEAPLQSYGFEWSGTTERMYWAYNIQWTPAIAAQLNDSIRLRLSGWNSMLYFGGDLIKSDVVDLCPAGGIGFQQLKLKTLKMNNPDTLQYSFREGDFRVYKRSALIGSAVLNLRINMSNATINFAGGYQFDCSSRLWRYNGKYLPESPKTDLSGAFFSVSFGVHIPDY